MHIDDVSVLYFGLAVFLIISPLTLIRRIERFAFTYIIADVLILITAIIIVIFASIHISHKQLWGEGV